MAGEGADSTLVPQPVKRRGFVAGLAMILALAGRSDPAAAQVDLSGLTSVPLLASRRQWDRVLALLQAGRSPDTPDDGGETALAYAAQFGDLTIVQNLLYFKARVDIADQFGNTPLFWAAERGSTDVMQALLDAKAAVDVQNRQGVTPLMTAASHGQFRAVRLLLKAGADPHKADFTGRDAFGWAEGKPNILQALRSGGGGG